jgi:hypothetical protein
MLILKWWLPQLLLQNVRHLPGGVQNIRRFLKLDWEVKICQLYRVMFVYILWRFCHVIMVLL